MGWDPLAPDDEDGGLLEAGDEDEDVCWQSPEAGDEGVGVLEAADEDEDEGALEAGDEDEGALEAGDEDKKALWRPAMKT